MKQLTPLITAALVVLGLIGFVAFNATRAVPSGSVAVPPVSLPAPVSTAPSATPTQPAPLPAEAVYAGKVEGGKLAVAIAVKGTKAVAYLCDGARTEAWLKGSAENGQIQVTAASGKASLTGGFDGSVVIGVAKVGVNEYHFTAGPAKKPAGLYRGKDGSTTIGWIVLPDGSQVGIANTGDDQQAAPLLDAGSGTATVNGRPLTAVPVSGDTPL
jgi:hypothetical protein